MSVALDLLAPTPTPISTPALSAPAPVTDLWVERARRGDQAALERLMRAELPRVTRFLRKRLGNAPDLDDRVQEVMTELLVALPRFRGDSQLSTFALGIASHVVRRAGRPTAWQARRAPMPEGLPAEDDPEAALARQDQARDLEVALSRLSEEHRHALIAWAVHGQTPAEISEATGASVAAVRSRIHYAKKYLRKHAQHRPALAEWLAA